MCRAVITIAQGVEDAEFVYPYYRLIEAEFVVDVATKGKVSITAKHGLIISANVDAEQIKEIDYDLLIGPWRLRISRPIQANSQRPKYGKRLQHKRQVDFQYLPWPMGAYISWNREREKYDLLYWLQG